MKYLPFLLICGLFTGCAMTGKNSPQETSECMNYRSMMTAPMVPSTLDELKEKCIKSKAR
ncbi:hypothetical protein MCL26_10610 [Acinetobacter pittii]|uniref:hypothetical protein n=1 Tax=Acinetobacter pittii TaxID=48296 RepID=UPI001EFEED5A|nr:hypothetical protein [Acinetobacter pittii]MCG9515552.1 hypothetical protein [Acinetobacter pittii]